MQYHLLSVLTHYRNSSEIDWFHGQMFHGMASRGGAYPNSQDARLAWDVDRPLRLHKNVYDLADVFAPEFELVVSERVKNSLAGIHGLRFQPVTFGLLYYYPYAINDFSHHDRIGHFLMQEEFIDSRIDDVGLHRCDCNYFLLDTPAVKDVRTSLQSARTINVDVRALEIIGDPVHEVVIGEDMAANCPIYRSGTFFLIDAIFERLAPFINWTYFRQVAFEA